MVGFWEWWCWWGVDREILCHLPHHNIGHHCTRVDLLRWKRRSDTANMSVLIFFGCVYSQTSQKHCDIRTVLLEHSVLCATFQSSWNEPVLRDGNPFKTLENFNILTLYKLTHSMQFFANFQMTLKLFEDIAVYRHIFCPAASAHSGSVNTELALLHISTLSRNFYLFILGKRFPQI